MQRSHFWIWSSALLLTVACGNTRTELEVEADGGSTPEDDATPGAGGSRNDGRIPDPVPPGPPPQTSLFFVIGAPGVPGTGCAIGNYIANIGGPPRSSAGDPGPREVDEVGDARVGCRVSGGPNFDISGSAEKGATAFVLLGGTVSVQGDGVGTIAVAGPGTAGRQLTSAEGGCRVSVSRAPFQIAPGAVWASFDCPVVSSPSDPGSNCSARGEFLFENCER
jgi:hypothetical protein